jgi:hypothetical protein
MKKLFLVVIVSLIAKEQGLRAMQYSSVKNSMNHVSSIIELNKKFKNIVLHGTLTELETCVAEHKKTYLEALKICAENNYADKVTDILSKIVPKKPVIHEKLHDYFLAEEKHYNTFVYGIIPTSHYLYENESSCTPCADIISISCGSCITLADIVAFFTAPWMTSEQKKLHTSYLKDYELRNAAKKQCMDIRTKALQKNALSFVKAFDNHKVAFVDDAFKEYN